MDKVYENIIEGNTDGCHIIGEFYRVSNTLEYSLNRVPEDFYEFFLPANIKELPLCTISMCEKEVSSWIGVDTIGENAVAIGKKLATTLNLELLVTYYLEEDESAGQAVCYPDGTIKETRWDNMDDVPENVARAFGL